MRGARGKRGFSVLAALACFALGACAPPQPKVYVRSNLEIRHYRLSNGLEVVLHPDKSLPDVTISVRYDSGSSRDPATHAGLAHLVEHLAFRRVIDPAKEPEAGAAPTRSRTIGDLETEIAHEYNAFTSKDATEYHMVVDAADLPLGLWLEAQRMASPLAGVTEEAFRSERSVVRNELRERYDNAPNGNVVSALASLMFAPPHPYHVDHVPPDRVLENANLATAASFAESHYRPSNAVVVIAGRFDTGQTARLVSGMFGALPALAPPRSKSHTLAPKTEQTEVAFDAGVSNPFYARAWFVPPPGHAGNLEAHLLAALLASYVRGTVERKKLSRCHAGVWDGRLGSLLVLTLELREGVDPSVAGSRVDEAIGYLVRTDVPPSNWGALKSSAIAEHTFDMEQSSGRASRFQGDRASFGVPDAFQAKAQAFSRIRFVDVIASARALLRNAHGASITAHPSPAAPRGGRPR